MVFYCFLLHNLQYAKNFAIFSILLFVLDYFSLAVLTTAMLRYLRPLRPLSLTAVIFSSTAVKLASLDPVLKVDNACEST